ncbi:hypothetical protein [Mucilaginibacter pedocola]|uniref:Uncharacterized protein n=1 Tax=Mucilaginibacter pedocola TaxID=1792845 RepID=A0A1S9PLB9_9SPHI|nr:hypothetical protein [Mucilaginibacter pedocola]OOQ61762.1 hypothetical protein BC343_01440 [Mucilaginibacter pedocola]
MKSHDLKNNNSGQGHTTSDRAFNNQNEKLKERGISNAGGQRSDQTSSRDSAHKQEHKKD